MSEKLENNYKVLEEEIINKLIDKKFINLFVDFIISNSLEVEFNEILTFISKAKREDIILSSWNFLYQISAYFSKEKNRELFELYLLKNTKIDNDNMNFYLKIISDINKFYLGNNIYNKPIFKWDKLEPVNNLWRNKAENIQIKIQDYVSKLLILNYLYKLYFKIWKVTYQLLKSEEFIYWNNLENISLLDLVWVLNVNQESRKVVELTLSKFQSYKITNIYDIFDISWKKIFFLEFLDWNIKRKALIDAFWNLLELQWIFDLEEFKLIKVQVGNDIFIKLDWRWIIDKDFKLLEYDKIWIDNIQEQKLNWKKYLINWKIILNWDEFERYLIDNYISFNTSDIQIEEIYK